MCQITIFSTSWRSIAFPDPLKILALTNANPRDFLNRYGILDNVRAIRGEGQN